MIRQSRHIHNLLPVLFTSFFLPVRRPSMRGYILSSLEWLNVGSFSCCFPTESSPPIWLTPPWSLNVASPAKSPSSSPEKIIHFPSSVWLPFQSRRPLKLKTKIIFPALVRALLGHRSQARANNGNFKRAAHAPRQHSPIRATCHLSL